LPFVEGQQQTVSVSFGWFATTVLWEGNAIPGHEPVAVACGRPWLAGGRVKFPVKSNMTQRDAAEVAAFLRQLAAVVENRCPDEANCEASTYDDGRLRLVTLALRW
jgi:hypothetical protein